MKRLLLIICIILGFPNLVKSQETFLLKDLRIPQALNENPGIYLPYQFHIGFPLLSRVQLGVNSPINYGNVMNIETKTLKKIHKNNFFRLGFREDFLDFGFRVKDKNYIYLTYAIRIDAMANLKDGLFKLLLEGNGNYENKVMKILDNDAIDISTYAEIGIGFNRVENRKFSWGLKAKYLLGIVNAYTKNLNMDFISSKNFDSLIIDYNMTAYINNLNMFLGMTNPQNGNSSMDYIKEGFSKNSHGFAIDFGMRYRVNRIFEIDAAITDLGFIVWRNGTKCSLSNTYVGYSGVPIPFDSSNTNLQPGEYIAKFFDSLLNEFNTNLDTQYIGLYTKMITTNFNIGGNIYASSKDRFSLNFNGKVFNGRFIPSGSVSYNRQFGKVFDVTIGNTFKSNSLLNPGIGFRLQLGVFQIYAALDYFNSFYIDKLKNINAVFGINFVAPQKNTKERASYH